MSSHVLMIARVVQPFGGVVQYVADVADALIEANYHVTLAITDAGREATCIQRVVRQGLELTSLVVSDRPEAFASHLDDLVKRINPDFIHLNDGSRVARGAVPRMKILPQYIGRRVVTLHADILKLGQVVSQSSIKLPWGKVARRYREVNQFLNCFDLAISVSEAFAQRIPRVLKLQATNVLAIPNGVDTRRFCPATSSRDTAETCIVSASGGLYKYKGFSVLIDAVALLKGLVPIEARIAGSGPEENQLRRQISCLGLEEHVRLVGRVDDMPKFLRDSNVFAFCSSSTETSSFSQLEAMAVGLPSVCSRYGDLPIRVRDGLDGFIVPPRDPQALADKLMILCKEPALRHRMGASARERVIEGYSKQAYLQKTIGAFDEMRAQSLVGGRL